MCFDGDFDAVLAADFVELALVDAGFDAGFDAGLAVFAVDALAVVDFDAVGLAGAFFATLVLPLDFGAALLAVERLGADLVDDALPFTMSDCPAKMSGFRKPFAVIRAAVVV